MKARVLGLLTAGLLAGPLAASAATLHVDVGGISSNEEIGNALNEVRTFNIVPGARVTGLGWDTVQTVFAPSWLSEMQVSFGNSNGLAALILTPGVADDIAGTASYGSGGIIDLIGLGLDFYVRGDGILRLEFSESFNDLSSGADGRWDRGTLSIRYAGADSEVREVPEPGTLMLLGLGLSGLGLGLGRRSAPAGQRSSSTNRRMASSKASRG